MLIDLVASDVDGKALKSACKIAVILSATPLIASIALYRKFIESEEFSDSQRKSRKRLHILSITASAVFAAISFISIVVFIATMSIAASN